MSNGMMMGPMRHFAHDASVVKAKVKPGTTKRIVRFAIPYGWLLGIFLFLVILDAGISVVNPLLYRDIINDGILKGNAGLIWRLALLAMMLSVFDVGLGLLQAYLSARIGSEIVLSIRTKLFDHIQKMPLAFFTRAQTGALVSRLNNDVTGAQTAFTDILSDVVGNIISVVLVLGAMFMLSWQITIASLLCVPVFLWPARFFGRKLQEIVRETYDVTATMNSMMVERFNVAGAQLAKIFGRRESETKAFESRARRVSQIGIRRALYGRFFFSALILTSSFATALVYGWGGILTIRGVLDVGTLVAFFSYLFRLYRPLAGLSNIQINIMTALVSFDRVFEVLDLVPMIGEKPNAVAIPPGPITIAFDRVSFRYPTAAEVSLASLESVAVTEKIPEKTILHDISFAVKPGQCVALVGPSGAGKTTITQLISRFYDPQTGSIRLNGIDLRDAKLDSVYQRIGVVTQEAYLFHDTIRTNLLYAKPEATEVELKQALGTAQILRLVESLPQGLDTLVGERGHRFSGGEKQRLCIARLILKAPEVIILDEATAHLDSESEAAIQKAFEMVLAGRTSVVIAHRLSTILHADEILVVNEGRIVERGPHADLLEKNGLYADLYRRQFLQTEP
jgi:ATP-binding cassette, subfamily B, bacterial